MEDIKVKLEDIEVLVVRAGASPAVCWDVEDDYYYVVVPEDKLNETERVKKCG